MIYFASDVHLGSGTPHQARATERKFVAWLDMAARDAEAIVLAGDIFDFWFEYNRVVPQGFARTLGKLAELTDRGIRVVLFTGNHDMWVGDYFARECGMEVHTSPQVLTLHGRRIFIAHGDNMQIDGKPMLKLLNRIFRSRMLRWLFAWGLHPDLAMRFGQWWSGKSRKSHRNQGTPDIRTTEPLIKYARNYAAAHAGRPVDHFIFGHMHAAYDFRDGALHTVHLGCWKEIPTYAVLHDNGELTLKRFEPATDNRNAEDR